MKTTSRDRLASIIAMMCSFLMASNCLAKTKEQPVSKPSLLEKSLSQFLNTWDGDKAMRYITAFHDLNSDGTPEAIVYLVGSKWCGSGGCTSLVLKQNKNHWKIVTKITITHPPIRVLSNVSHGWHNISVWVQGGSITTGYDAELIFNGKTYPTNPTIPPALQLKEESTGEVVIPLQNTESK